MTANATGTANNALPAGQPAAGNNAAAAATNAAMATNPAADAANRQAQQQLYATFDRQYLVPLTSVNNQGASLSDALNDMSNLLSARHKRLRDISVAIAQHASATGQFDALALQRLQLESTTNEQFSQLQKSIFEKMSGAIQAWVSIR